jgi:hypothetical protein
MWKNMTPVTHDHLEADETVGPGNMIGIAFTDAAGNDWIRTTTGYLRPQRASDVIPGAPERYVVFPWTEDEHVKITTLADCNSGSM